MNILKMEIEIANYFEPRRNLIVPNVWWGLGFNHECDLLVVTRSGYATEIEIKTNLNDLKQDLKKTHNHRSNLIRKLYFAVPENLLPHTNIIQERAGIISVCKFFPTVRIYRVAKLNKMARPLSQAEMLHLGSLAAMRIWTLKQTLERKLNEAQPYSIEAI